MKAWRISMWRDGSKICNFLIILFLVLSIFILNRMKSQYCPSPYGKAEELLKLEKPRTGEKNQLTVERRQSSIQEDEDDEEENNANIVHEPICQELNKRSDTCDARGDVRIQSINHTIFINSTKKEWKIKPYARKGDDMGALSHVSEWSLKPFVQVPNCTLKQDIPAVIFSINGYTGNMFHDFTDVIIPLFITTHQFHGRVQLLVTDTKPWWANKYKLILNQLSTHEPIDLAKDDSETIRCFSRVITGLHFHKELGVDSSKSPTGYSIVDFKVLLRKACRLERAAAVLSSVRKPRLLIISRNHSRSFVNEKGIVGMAAGLGFDVVVGEAGVSTDVSKFARLVNSADVLMGVHGAGLTNMVFLPSGAVVIQIVPYGGLEWLARETFMKPSRELELKYLEYRIQEEESTLIDQYSREDPVLRDPERVHKKGWNAMKTVYLEKQNVRPRLDRLKNTLMEALKLLRAT
ncbi:hypothetical protein KSP40_PGU010046 [Platanthera guangdongensis]|uniref:Glycosyltransferase 61 catalytic domain-containing protein n=1 Tax=Platanthera guangdongensis TaxID=2320717 RepID=A0ABR2LEI5_9ASPA